MKLFGNFLLDAGLISAENLAQALIEQVKQTPSSLVVLYEHKRLDAKQVLDILMLQNNENVDFRTACIALNIWRDEFIDIIKAELAQKRPTLGQILVEKGWLEPLVLLPSLKQFHSYRAENNNNFALFSESNFQELKPQKNSPELITEIFSGFEPDFTQVHISNAAEYIELFSEEKETAMELAILSIESLSNNKSIEPAEEILDSFFTDFHSLKGTARGVGAILTENIIHEAEELLTFFKRFLHQVENSDFIALSSVNLIVLDVLHTLREELINSGSEQKYWEQADLKQKYLSGINDIQILMKEMEDRGYKIDLEEVRDMF